MTDDKIDTGPFAHRCTLVGTVWPPGSTHRVRLVAVHAGDLPDDVLGRLRAAGGGPLDDPHQLVPLGEEAALGRPRTTVTVSEVVRLLKDGREAAGRRRAGAGG